MSLLPVRIWPDPVLSEMCATVAQPADVADLAQDMLETMYAAPGRGLAAPQVGHALRLFVMNVGWKEGAPSPMICVNPEIIARAPDRVVGPEGCLSIPGVTAQVERATWIEMRWQTPDGPSHSARLDGFAAICAQHEADHLDGVVTFDRLSPDARAQAEMSYAG